MVEPGFKTRQPDSLILNTQSISKTRKVLKLQIYRAYLIPGVSGSG